LVLIRRGDSAQERTLESADELTATLRDVFGFDLGEFADGTLTTLWERARAAHLAWELPGVVDNPMS
jgi:hypothetical protein